MTRPSAAFFVLVFIVASVALAQETQPAAPELESRVAELEARIAQLESRIAQLEQALESTRAQRAVEERRAMWQPKVRERIARDAQLHSRAELAEAEQLYQTANKNWRSPEAKAALDEMVRQFPNINRTGCALVYLGQFSEGDEKVRYLKQALEHHADCFYGDGSQVGPLAMFYLAHHYTSAGKPEEAQPFIDKLRSEHPQAISHSGKPLVDALP